MSVAKRLPPGGTVLGRLPADEYRRAADGDRQRRGPVDPRHGGGAPVPARGQRTADPDRPRRPRQLRARTDRRLALRPRRAAAGRNRARDARAVRSAVLGRLLSA